MSRLRVEYKIANRQIQREEIQVSGERFELKTNHILSIVSRKLSAMNIKIQSHIKIEVEVDKKRQNIFVLKKKGLEIPLKMQGNMFVLRLYVELCSEKISMIKNFHMNMENFNRLEGSIQRILDENSSLEKERASKTTRPIDIAYFFADPLVEIVLDQGKMVARSHLEVSFQNEYDRFIEVVRQEDFPSNFRVEVMAATSQNIKNTLDIGVSVIHFACHGTQKSLRIESDKNVGELVQLKIENLIQLFKSTNLPRLIIFNACHSHIIAKKLAEEKNIITIGYNDEAADVECQNLTRQIYLGLFKDRRPIREVFQEIKQEVTSRAPKQGSKLCIFPAEPSESQYELFGEISDQNLNYVIRWTPLQNLREDDALGVRKELHSFIKNYLLSNQRMSYIFLIGQKNSGKTNFLLKTRLYTMNRKKYTNEYLLDLKYQHTNKVVRSVLELKLQHQEKFLKWKAKLLSSEERVIPLIIIDHAQKLVKYQFQKFVKYVEEVIMENFQYGKVVIATKPMLEHKIHMEYFRKATKHYKMKPELKYDEVKNFVHRYVPEQMKQIVIPSLTQRIPMINIVKAAKMCQNPGNYKNVLQQIQREADTKEYWQPWQKIKQQWELFKHQVAFIASSTALKLQQKCFIYISTILYGLIDYSKQKRPSIGKVVDSKQTYKMIKQLSDKFSLVFRKMVHIDYNQTLKIMKEIFDISLKIAGLCFLYFKNNKLFQFYLLICQRIHCTLSFYFHKQQYEDDGHQAMGESQIKEQLKLFRIKILMTLYSYYSERQHKDHIQQDGNKTSFEKKLATIKLQLIQEVDKLRKNQVAEQELNIVLELCKMAHKIYEKKVEIINKKRKNSDPVDMTDEYDFQEKNQNISNNHTHIIKYWKKLAQLNKIHQSLLLKDDYKFFTLALFCLMIKNQNDLLSLHVKGQNFVKKDMLEYVEQYIKILQQINNNYFFGKMNQKIWGQNNSCRQLYRIYVNSYIVLYFQFQRIRQSLTKEYSIKIYNELLGMCAKYYHLNNLASTKKLIQLHKDQQFLSNYTCITYTAIPLRNLREKNHRKYINVKRYENHINSFQQEFFNNVNKQVKHEIYTLTPSLFTQSLPKSLITLLVVDCAENQQKIYCQTTQGTVWYLSFRQIASLPNSPVIIIFGMNPDNLANFYRHKQAHRTSKSTIVTIRSDIDSFSNIIQYECRFGGKNRQNQRQQRINYLRNYSNRLEINYRILRYFYTSFCQHFFNSDQSLFYDQVSNSFNSAKTQANVKFKIWNESENESQKANKEINIVNYANSLLRQCELILPKDEQIFYRPAYHFIHKEHSLSKLNPNPPRCNSQVCRALKQIMIQNRKLIYVMYKSKQMCQYFVNTLSIKLKKQKGITIHQIGLIPELRSLKSGESERQTNYQNREIYFYYDDGFDLLEAPVQVMQLGSNEVKIYMVKYKNSAKSMRESILIQENYQNQTLQYELNFVSWAPHDSKKNLLSCFKKVVEENNSSLQKVLQSLQRKKSHH